MGPERWAVPLSVSIGAMSDASAAARCRARAQKGPGESGLVRFSRPEQAIRYCRIAGQSAAGRPNLAAVLSTALPRNSGADVSLIVIH